MKKIYVSWQNQHYQWQQFGYYHSEISAYTIAKARAKATGKRYRLKSDDGSILDYIDP